MAGLLREYGDDPLRYPKLFSERYTRFRYSEAFWEMIGVQELATLDVSNYEGASIVHDLNAPIPADLNGRFDAVCDFGTLEHVFNLPVALRNCLEMVATGGRFFVQTPANNYFGHGFYQFSPELFFRALTPRNGYRIERMIAVEYGPCHRWYRVSDPAEIRARVPLVNSFPVMLFVQAQRTSVIPVLQDFPHQSDCEAQWSGEASPQQSGVVDRWADTRIDILKRGLLECAPRLARWLEAFRFSGFSREWSLRNTKAFQAVKTDPKA